jgi:hypothetical protein
LGHLAETPSHLSFQKVEVWLQGCLLETAEVVLIR